MEPLGSSVLVVCRRKVEDEENVEQENDIQEVGFQRNQTK